MLGGGRARLQGQYGFLVDQLVEARVILANGSALTVSTEHNSDLFWAMRGGGHNYGVVTEFKYRIYDVQPGSTWAVEVFMFAGEKLEAIYSFLNELRLNMPPQLDMLTDFAMDPVLDPINVSLFNRKDADETADGV